MLRLIKTGIYFLFIFFIALFFYSSALPEDTIDDSIKVFVPNEFELVVPSNLAKIEKVIYGKNGKSVILVRDIHANPSAQQNLAGLIAYLNGNYSITSCFVEGYDGFENLRRLSGFPDRKAREKIALNYLKNGKIAGEEYFCIANPNKLTIFGIENKDIYYKHIAVFRKIIEKQPGFNSCLSHINQSILSSKLNRKYSELMYSFDDALSLKKEPVCLINAIDKLNNDNNKIKQKYKNIIRYIDNLKDIELINHKELGYEFITALGELKKDAPEKMRQSFNAFEKLKNNGEIADSNYYLAVFNLLQAKLGDTRRFPNYTRYIRHINRSMGLNLNNIFHEIYLYGLECIGSEHKEALRAYNGLWAIHKLKTAVNCELNTDEAVRLTQNSKGFAQPLIGSIKPFAIEAGIKNQLEGLSGLISLVKDYYEIAFERDSLMASNLIKNISQPQNICITGGFHTNAIADKLSGIGYTVVIVSPKITDNISGSNYINIITNKLDGYEKLFAAQSSNLRQQALAWRVDEQKAMELDIISESLLNISDKNMALFELGKLISNANEGSLLSIAALYVDNNSIYIDFNRYGLSLKITYDGSKANVIERITGSLNRIPDSAKFISSYHINAKKFSNFIDMLYMFSDEPQIDFTNPSAEFSILINTYKNVMSIESISDEDIRLIKDAILSRSEFKGAKYNYVVTDIFMKAFYDNKPPDISAKILEAIYNINKDNAKLIIRSIGEGKHFQIGDILFAVNEDISIDLIKDNLVSVNDADVKEFHKTGFFAGIGILSARYSVVSARKQDAGGIASIVNKLEKPYLKILLTNAYQYYFVEPAFKDMLRRFILFVNDTVGRNIIEELFSENTDRDIILKSWVNELIENKALPREDIEKILLSQPNYARIRKMDVSMDSITAMFDEVVGLAKPLEPLNEVMPISIPFIIDHINMAKNYLLGKETDLAIQAWGKAADEIDKLVNFNKELSINPSLRLIEYIEERIDGVFAEYILVNGIGKIKSIIPHDRQIVVAKLKFIPSDSGLSLLLDNGLLEDGFAVVNQYPVNDPSLAKPRAIIAEKGVGQREHAAKLAQHWNIPYVVLPHGRKLLIGLSGTRNNERWIAVEIGKGVAGTKIRRASNDEVEAETNYRQGKTAEPSVKIKYKRVIEPDLSSLTPLPLDKISINDANQYGVKTARLGFMLSKGINVKEGFGVPFGVYNHILYNTIFNGKTLRENIQEILSKPDFDAKKEHYLLEIRQMFTLIDFPAPIKSDIQQIYKTIDPDGKGVIVRSSMSDEDAPGFFTAGMYASTPNVFTGQDLFKAILKTYSSLWSVKAYNHRLEMGVDHLTVYGSALVQGMISAQYSGVIETSDTEGNISRTGFSVAPSHGGAVEGDAAEFVFDTKTGNIDGLQTDIPYSLKDTVVSTLSQNDFAEMDKKARQVSALFGVSQNIEFAVDDKNSFIVTQSQDFVINTGLNNGLPENNKTTDNTVSKTVNKDVVLKGHHGIFAYLAHKIKDIVEASSSKVTIKSFDGVSADATNVLGMIKLGVYSGSTLLIEAKGVDADDVLQKLTGLLTTPLFPQEIYLSPSDFFIFTVRGKNGLHQRPSEQIRNLIPNPSDSSDAVTILPLEANGKPQPVKSTGKYVIVPYTAKQGQKFMISANTPVGRKIIQTVHFFALYDNLGDIETPNGLDSIPLSQVISSGELLVLDEKEAIDQLSSLLSNKTDKGVVSEIQVNIASKTVSFLSSKGESIDVGVSDDITSTIFRALNREPHAEDYLLLTINKSLPDIRIEVIRDNNKPSASILEVQKKVFLTKKHRLSSYTARKLASAAKLYKSSIEIAHASGKLFSMMPKINVEITDFAGLVKLSIKKNDAVFIRAKGEDAQEAVEAIAKILDSEEQYEGFVSETPRFLLMSLWGSETFDYKKFTEIVNKYNAVISLDILRKEYSRGGHERMTVYKSYPNIMDINPKEIVANGTYYKISATGPEAKQALIELQLYVNHFPLNRSDDLTKAVFESYIKDGEWLADDEIEAFESFLKYLKTKQMELITILIDINDKKIGYIDLNGKFIPAEIDRSVEDKIFSALVRDLYAEDFFILKSNELLFGKGVIINRDTSVNEKAEKPMLINIRVESHNGIYSFIAREIADSLSGVSSPVYFVTESGKRASAKDHQAVINLNIKQGEKIYIEAQGDDALKAVDAIQLILASTSLEKKYITKDTAFFILFVSSDAGISIPQFEWLNNLALRYPDTSLLMVGDTEAYPNEYVFKMKFGEEMSGFSSFSRPFFQKNRFKIIVEGPHAKEILWEVRQYSLYHNFGNKFNEGYDIDLNTIIEQGYLLTDSERQGLRAVSEVLMSQTPLESKSININIMTNSIWYININGDIVYYDLPEYILPLLFSALKREVYAEDYLVKFLSKKDFKVPVKFIFEQYSGLQNIQEQVLNELIAEKNITIDKQILLSAYHARKIAGIVEQSASKGTITTDAGKVIDINDTAGIVAEGITKNAVLKISITGIDAENTLLKIEDFLNQPLKPIDRFDKPPQFLIAQIRHRYGLHARPYGHLIQLVSSVDFGLSNLRFYEIYDHSKYAGGKPFNSIWGNFIYTSRVKGQRDKGTLFKISGSGKDFGNHIAILQDAALHDMFGEPPSQYDIPLIDTIRSGVLFEPLEKQALDNSITSIASKSPVSGIKNIEVNLFAKEIGFVMEDGSFIKIDSSSQEKVFDVFAREPYSEDYLLYNIRLNMPDINVSVIRDNKKTRVKKVEKNIVLSEFPYITAYVGRKIVGIAKESSSAITIISSSGQRAHANSLFDLVNLGVNSGDKLVIEASGADSDSVVERIANILSTPVDFSTIRDSAPDFLILYTRNYRGIHVTPSYNFINYASKYEVNFKLEWIKKSKSEDGGNIDEIVTSFGTLIDLISADRIIPKGSRLRLTATGDQTAKALFSMQEYANRDILGEPKRDNDIKFYEMVESGELLSASEYDSMMEILIILKHIRLDEAKSIVISTKDEKIGFLTKENLFIPVTLSDIHIKNLFSALKREPYSEDFIFMRVKHMFKGIDVEITDKEYQVKIDNSASAHGVTVINGYGVHANVVNNIVDIANVFKNTQVLIFKINPKTSEIEKAVANDTWQILSLLMKRGDYIVIFAKGDEAELAVESLSTLFNLYIGDNRNQSLDLPSGINFDFKTDKTNLITQKTISNRVEYKRFVDSSL